jgi:hypothetical protein
VSASRPVVTLKQYADGWYAVTFTYHPLVVSLIKCIPAVKRAYVPATRTWRIARRYARPLMRDLQLQGFGVELVELPWLSK